MSESERCGAAAKARPEGFRRKCRISRVAILGRSYGYCHSARTTRSAAFPTETRSAQGYAEVPYTILGACNPKMAWEALKHEPKIGAMLPCNVVVRELEDGKVEVSAVDPQASMQAVENRDLGEIAGEVRARLQRVIDAV